MIDALPEKDLIGLGYWGLGFRNATNSEPSDRQGRGLRRAEAARDPEPGLSRDLQGVQSQSGADGRSASSTPRSRTRPSTDRKIPTASSCRTSSSKCRNSSRRPTTPTRRTSCSSSKKFWDRLSPEEQKMIRDSYRGDARLSARADQDRGREGARRAQGQGHAVQRDRAGRIRAHAGGDQGRDREVLRRLRSRQGEAVQRRA